MNLRIPASLGPLVLFAWLVTGCGGASAPLAPRSASATGPGATPSSASALSPTAPSPNSVDAPPVVRITSPVPNHLLAHLFQFGQPATIQWAATDPDGPGPGVRDYRYLLISDDVSEIVDFTVALVEPDSIIRRDAPEFANWTKVDGSVDHVTFSGLDQGRRYVFLVTAFDRRHVFDPVVSLEKNELLFAFSNLGAPSAQTVSGAPPSRRAAGLRDSAP